MDTERDYYNCLLGGAFKKKLSVPTAIHGGVGPLSSLGIVLTVSDKQSHHGRALLVDLSSCFRDETPEARKGTSLKIIRLVDSRSMWGPGRDRAPKLLALNSALLALFNRSEPRQKTLGEAFGAWQMSASPKGKGSYRPASS